MNVHLKAMLLGLAVFILGGALVGWAATSTVIATVILSALAVVVVLCVSWIFGMVILLAWDTVKRS